MIYVVMTENTGPTPPRKIDIKQCTKNGKAVRFGGGGQKGVILKLRCIYCQVVLTLPFGQPKFWPPPPPWVFKS